jgi:hypothetical protein
MICREIKDIFFYVSLERKRKRKRKIYPFDAFSLANTGEKWKVLARRMEKG